MGTQALKEKRNCSFHKYLGSKIIGDHFYFENVAECQKKKPHIGSDGRFRPSGLRLGVTKCQDLSVYSTAPDKTGLMTNLAIYEPEHNWSDSGGV